MLRQINPYNALAIYDRDTPQARIGYLYSPISHFVPFQFPFTDQGDTLDTWELRNTATGTSALQSNALLVLSVTATDGWLTYDGGALDNAPIAGIWQAVITMKSGLVYYSHAVAMSYAFQAFGSTSIVKGTCLTSPGGDIFTINFEAFYAAWGEGRILLDVLGNDNFVFLSTDNNFTLTQAHIGEFGASSILRIETAYYLPNEPGAMHRIYRDYRFTYTEGDPCSGTFVATGAAVGEYSENVMVLEWTNPTDYIGLNLLYQTGYTQKLYLFLYRLEFTPVVEESYQRNAAGTEFLRQSVFIEEQAHDFFPYPDYLAEVIRTIRHHSSKGVRFLNSALRPLYNIQAERKEIAQSDIPAGTLRMQMLPNYVQGCESDFELVE